MPQLTSPLSTPTGMPALNSAHLGKAAGLRIHFALFSDFTAAITTGTSSYAADLWADGQEMTIASEADSGAVRIWRTALGHARTVRVRRLEVVLPANTNVVLAAAGIPAAGTGTNGDLSVDKAAGIAYLKTAGTWASAGNIGELSAAAASAVQSAFNAGSSFTSTTLGPVADLATLGRTYPAASYSGKSAQVGSAAPYVMYDSNGVAWVARSPQSDFNVLPYLSKAKLEGPSAGASFATAATGASGQCWQVQTVAECDYDAIQVGVYNADTVPVAGITMTALAPSLQQADSNVASNYNSATWSDLTIAGSASGTAAALSWLWSDVLQLPSTARADSGKTLPLLQVRVGYPTGVNYTYLQGPGASGSAWETDSSAVGNRPFRVRLQAVTAASNANKANLTSASMQTSFWPPIIIRYWPRGGAARTMILYGDSQASNLGGNVPRYHFAQVWQAAVSTPAKPVELVCCSLGGGTSSQFQTHGQIIGGQVPGATALLQIGTVNGTSSTLSATDVAGWRYYKAKFREFIRSMGQKPILVTQLPTPFATKAWGSTDSFRRAMNASDVAISDIKVLDLSTVVSGGIDVNGQEVLAYTTDNLHVSDPGAVLETAYMQAKVVL